MASSNLAEIFGGNLALKANRRSNDMPAARRHLWRLSGYSAAAQWRQPRLAVIYGNHNLMA
jgi:hypothetical protein